MSEYTKATIVIYLGLAEHCKSEGQLRLLIGTPSSSCFVYADLCFETCVLTSERLSGEFIPQVNEVI